MEKELSVLLTRIADGIEKLAEDPVVEIESGPPVCPHCNTFNPEVFVRESTSKGPLFGYFIAATCGNCNQPFYAIPEHLSMCVSRNQLEIKLRERGIVND